MKSDSMYSIAKGGVYAVVCLWLRWIAKAASIQFANVWRSYRLENKYNHEKIRFLRSKKPDFFISNAIFCLLQYMCNAAIIKAPEGQHSHTLL